MASQAGSQAGSHLPGDSTTSKTGSAVPHNIIPTREGPSHAGNKPPTQAGKYSLRHAGAQLGIGPSGFQREQCHSSGKQHYFLGRHSSENHNPKWVINLSSKPLTQAQRSVLAKGSNYVVSPKHPPNLEYITAIEAAFTELNQQDAEELRAEINKVLRSSHPPKPNLTKAQNIALRELKRDRDCIVLTADKGVAMVIMDRQDYINKANSLLNQNTYRSIPRDPTNTIKNKLISILKRVKNQTGLDSNTYKSMYPTGCVP